MSVTSFFQTFFAHFLQLTSPSLPSPPPLPHHHTSSDLLRTNEEGRVMSFFSLLLISVPMSSTPILRSLSLPPHSSTHPDDKVTTFKLSKESMTSFPWLISHFPEYSYSKPRNQFTANQKNVDMKVSSAALTEFDLLRFRMTKGLRKMLFAWFRTGKEDRALITWQQRRDKFVPLKIPLNFSLREII